MNPLPDRRAFLAAPLFAHLAESEALSDEDIAEIEHLLRELKK